MIVKIVNTADSLGESLYECSRLHVRPTIDPGGVRERSVFFDMEGPTECVSIAFPVGTGVQVYVMNNEGKTVDRYNMNRDSWPEEASEHLRKAEVA